MPDWQPRKPSILILANGDAIDACLITSARVAHSSLATSLAFPDEPDRCYVLIGCGAQTFDVTFHDVDEANAERDRVIEAWRAATDEARPTHDDVVRTEPNVAATVALERWDTWAVDLLGKGDSRCLWRQVLRTEITQKCTTVDIEGFRRTHEQLAVDLTNRTKDRDDARRQCCVIMMAGSAMNPEFTEQHFAAQYGWSYLYPVD